MSRSPEKPPFRCTPGTELIGLYPKTRFCTVLRLLLDGGRWVGAVAGGLWIIVGSSVSSLRDFSAEAGGVPMDFPYSFERSCMTPVEDTRRQRHNAVSCIPATASFFPPHLTPKRVTLPLLRLLGWPQSREVEFICSYPSVNTL